MKKSPTIGVFVAVVLVSAAAATSPEDLALRAKANALLVQAQKLAVFDPNVTRTPFHESVSFLFFGLIHGDQKGTFVRDWASKEQWRWKWEVPDYQEIDVRNGGQIGERATAEFEPLRILQLRWALPPFHVLLGENDLVKKLELEKVNGLAARCIKFEAVRGRDRVNCEVCVNAANNTLLRWSDEQREIDWTDYTPFGEKFYPRHLVVQEHGNKIIQADIEFRDAPDVSPREFEMPSDMRLHKACEHFTGPIVTKQESPIHPRHAWTLAENAVVVVEVRVGVEGKVEAAQIIETGGSDLDLAALDAVKKWEFEPAKCDGDPVSDKSTVAVYFH